ncbi:MAG: shikimate kinase [Christensenellales bacterium]|jgi:shikimate kinase
MALTRENIIIIGFMGTQKSTAGSILAERAGMRFVDTDEEIEKKYGMPISQMFQQLGEKAFRDAETDWVRTHASANGWVVSTGGGFALREENMRALSGRVVLLTCEPDELWRRIGQDQTRPMVNGKAKQEIKSLLDARAPVYAAYAEFSVDTTHRTPEQTAQHLMELLQWETI